MKKLALVILVLILMFNCNSNDDESQLDGKTYVMTSFIIDEVVDLNGDGFFSNELLEEDDTQCLSSKLLNFNASQVNPVWDYILILNVETINGNLTQVSGCGINDYFRYPDYTIQNNKVTISFDNDIHAVGQLDGDNIIFSFDNTQGTIQEILNEDNTVTNYQGGVTMIYTLE